MNDVGDTHTFVVHGRSTTLGSASPRRPDGTIVDVTLTDADGTRHPARPTRAPTPAPSGGTCSVTFTSDLAGTRHRHAEADIAHR